MSVGTLADDIWASDGPALTRSRVPAFVALCITIPGMKEAMQLVYQEI